VWELLMKVHADYLNAMFSELDDTHGSVAGYFNTIGIDFSVIGRMRDQLLE